MFVHYFFIGCTLLFSYGLFALEYQKGILNFLGIKSLSSSTTNNDNDDDED